MTHHTQLNDKLGEADNFWAWKYKISLILKENDLDQFISMEVLEPKGDERIIAYSIKDHLVPHVSSLKTPKEVFDALTKLFGGKKINQKMRLMN